MKAVIQSNNHRQMEARLRRGHAHPQGRRRASSKPPRAFNGLIPRERIQAYCDAVAREFRPRQIILFGSYAYGTPRPDSDVDLLVVLPFQGSDVAKAMQIRSRFDTPFPMDLMVRKPEFIAQRRQERDMFIELVMTRGRVIYESQHA
jgi:predicted nucleotidyltransferase